MVHGPPDHCPACGTALTDVQPPTVFQCETCEEYVFHNPTPNCRVAVVDGERVLLVEILDEFRVEDPPYPDGSEWMLPGGHPHVGEQPAETAARELDEETNLTVDPADLVLFDAVERQVVDGVHGLVVLYAVERRATDGRLRAASDAGDARFWTPAELSESDAVFRDLYAEPDPYGTFEGWVQRARRAVDGSG